MFGTAAQQYIYFTFATMTIASGTSYSSNDSRATAPSKASIATAPIILYAIAPFETNITITAETGIMVASSEGHTMVL